MTLDPSNQDVVSNGRAALTTNKRTGIPVAVKPPTDSLLRAAEAAVAILVALGFAVLLLRNSVSAGGLWRDEATSVGLATAGSISEIWRHLDSDSFPILWILVLRAWASLGLTATDIHVRILGLLIALCIPLALFLNARMGKYGFPYLAFALIGFNPVFIRCIESNRAYGMGIALALVTNAMVWRTSQSFSRRNAAASFLAAALSVQCIYYNLVFVGAICLAGAIVAGRRRAWQTTGFFGLTVSVCAISMLPYIPTFQRQHSWSVLVSTPANIDQLPLMASAALESSGLGMALVWIILFLFGGAVAVLCQSGGLRQSVSLQRNDLAVYSAIVMGTAAIGYFLFLAKLGYPTGPWYYAALMALIGVSLDGLMSVGLPRSPVRACRVGLAGVIAVCSLAPAWRGVHFRQTNVDFVAARLNTEAVQGDLVVVNPWYYGISFDRYYRGAAEWQTVPPMRFHKYGGMDLIKQEMATPHPLDPLFDRMTKALRSGHRIWLVGEIPGLGPAASIRPLPPAPFAASGWAEAPYRIGWGQLIGFFLQSHSHRISVPGIPWAERVNGLECSGLQEFQGWYGFATRPRPRP